MVWSAEVEHIEVKRYLASLPIDSTTGPKNAKIFFKFFDMSYIRAITSMRYAEDNIIDH